MAVTLESRIDHVMLYARGARVRRVATLARPLPREVRIVGLPIAAIDDTVRVELSGGGLVRAVRTTLDLPATAPAAEVTPELADARRRAALARTTQERIAHAVELAEAAPIALADPTDEPPAAWTDVIAARRALLVARGQRELALREQLAVAARERDLADEALRIAEARAAAASTAHATKLHELRKVIELELELDDAAADGVGEVELRIEYQVASARWAPAYVARLDGETVTVELRAVVAQASGEDWNGAALALSTAEPARFAALPELHAQRIGRRQDAPVRSGFKAPPTGARALYGDYERAFPSRPSPAPTSRAPAPPPPPLELLEDGIADEVWDDEESNAKEAFHTPVGGSPPIQSLYQQDARGGGGRQMSGREELARRRAPTGAPMPSMPSMAPMASAMAAPMRNASDLKAKKQSLEAPEEAAGGMVAGMAGEVMSTPRLDYGNLRMASPSSTERGALVAAARGDVRAQAIAAEVATCIRRIAELALPSGCAASWDHTYDYAYVAEGRVDVTSDGAWTSLAIAAKPGTAKLRHVAVPREQPDAFRVAAIANPFGGPLLPGPIDIYDRGQFLVTSTVEFTPPGGTVEVGLGVDPLVKIARNTEFREEAAGMLRGALKLVHAFVIDVENL
ncbi:MAG: DUF4139 domain-containing protein, partial [Proteobacteria bacterium]|nr:DUF4139 domain-containing protein [Pseudomonadota bacterium]